MGSIVETMQAAWAKTLDRYVIRMHGETKVLLVPKGTKCFMQDGYLQFVDSRKNLIAALSGIDWFRYEPRTEITNA